MDIKVVCFDLGGVLIHVTYKWSEASRAAGIPAKVDDHLTLDEFSSFPLFQAGQLSAESYILELSAFLDVTPPNAERIHNHILLEPTDGTYEIIEGLNKSGIVTGCLSNTNGPHWTELLDANRFPNIGLLSLKVASQEVGHNKPAPEIYRHFEMIAGVMPNEILFFDDLRANIDGAVACGWHVGLIDHDKPQAQQIKAILLQHGVI